MRYGLNAMRDLERLPELYRDAQVHYEGSIDKRGGNADWDWWLYQDERGEWVIFEACGPGCVYNIVQHRYLSSTDPLFRFYFDGEETPRFEIHASEFGLKYPFVEPLAGRYIGPVDNGRGPIRVIRSFVPMEFEKSLRITTDVRLEGFERARGDGGWGHVIWHSYAENPGLKTFDGTEDYRTLLTMYKKVGVDPKPRTETDESRVFDATLEGGGSLALAEAGGAGSVQAIRLRLRDFRPEMLGRLWLRARWDDHADDDVCCPIGCLFGNELGCNPVRYLMMGMDTGGDMYNYFPMPYWENARIVLENRGDKPVALDYAEVSMARGGVLRREECGYFRSSAYYRRAHTEGADSMIARISGRGHAVAAVITAHAKEPGVVSCEGDVRVHIDGILTPQVESDGSESYACYGWGFPTPPECNCISGYDGLPDSPWSMTRTLVGDSYPFRSRLDFGIESGGCNDQYLEHSGIVFYYGRDDEAIVETDGIDFADEASVRAHGVSGRAGSCAPLAAFYEGDDDDVEVKGCVAVFDGPVTFDVRLSAANRGVRLRRRSDQREGRQAARVYVDGKPVSERIWCAPDHNPFKRWLDDEFQIPAGYTAGRDRVRIQIEPIPQGGAITWNQSAYRVFSLL